MNRRLYTILVPTVVLIVGLCGTAPLVRTAFGAAGDCGQPVTSGVLPTATDALFALRAAVGSTSCFLYICDTDDNGKITAGDALRILQRAVIGPSIVLRCPAAPATTTTTATTTTSVSTTTTVPAGGVDVDCAMTNGTLTLSVLGGVGDAPLSGTLTIACGDPSSGSAACSCSLTHIDPVDLGGGIGVLCVTQTDRCSGGSLQCRAGAGAGVDVVSDHSIGTCTDNAACASDCSTACAAEGKSMLSSGCEGFCATGVNADKACTASDECPDSVCNGLVTEHGNLCACHCFGRSGTPAPAGALECRVGLGLTVESAAPCDGVDRLDILGDQCLILNSSAATSQFRDFNLMQSPANLALQGNSLSCQTLLSGNASGLKLVGAVSLVDTTIGDLIAGVQATCQ